MKKFLIFVFLVISINGFSQLDTVNTGTGAPNSGETLKTAFPKVNDAINLLNTLQLYDVVTNSAELNILNGALWSTTEGNYLVGTTSPIQTQLNAKPDTTGQVDGSTIYSMLAPDTVQHTSNYTVAASDWAKDQHCLKATSIVITLPINLTEWPVGGIMNFYGEGAGIMVFKGGTKISDSDSIATSRKGQVVSVKKLAASKYFLLGPLTD